MAKAKKLATRLYPKKGMPEREKRAAFRAMSDSDLRKQRLIAADMIVRGGPNTANFPRAKSDFEMANEILNTRGSEDVN